MKATAVQPTGVRLPQIQSEGKNTRHQESWIAVIPEYNCSESSPLKGSLSILLFVASYISKTIIITIIMALLLSVQREHKVSRFFFSIFTNCDLKILNISI